MSYSRQTHQVVFGFGHGLRVEEIKADMTLFLFNLLKYLLDSNGFDLA
jgi:hypothetical protein